jgi:glycosyltransferase involved in cell wall biosynthesis
MRILHVIESMGMGGAERHLANLLRPLAALGVENDVATFWPGAAYQDSVEPFARVHAFGLPKRRVITALPSLVRLARDADVVHTQLPWADIVGRLAALAARRPCVTTLQSTWYDEANMDSFEPAVRRRVRMIRRIDATTAPITRRFFAVSDVARRTYVRELHVPAHKVELIPNSVNLAAFDSAQVGSREEARAAIGCAPDELAIMMVARLVAPKGHTFAIEAVLQLQRRMNLRLFVAGTGPEESALRALVAERRAPVTFIGACTNVPRLLRAADIFLFPSVIEGLPLVLLEAMAMGLPCVCSDIPENREASGEAAIYTPVADVAAIAAAIERLHHDRALAAHLATVSRQRAAAFSSETVAARLLESIRRVVDRAG